MANVDATTDEDRSDATVTPIHGEKPALDLENLPPKHELGKLVTEGIAGYIAGKLAGHAYDKVLVALHSRRK